MVEFRLQTAVRPALDRVLPVQGCCAPQVQPDLLESMEHSIGSFNCTQLNGGMPCTMIYV